MSSSEVSSGKEAAQQPSSSSSSSSSLPAPAAAVVAVVTQPVVPSITSPGHGATGSSEGLEPGNKSTAAEVSSSASSSATGIGTDGDDVNQDISSNTSSQTGVAIITKEKGGDNGVVVDGKDVVVKPSPSQSSDAVIAVASSPTVAAVAETVAPAPVPAPIAVPAAPAAPVKVGRTDITIYPNFCTLDPHTFPIQFLSLIPSPPFCVNVTLWQQRQPWNGNRDDCC